jgi:hypothetical protein
MCPFPSIAVSKNKFKFPLEKEYCVDVATAEANSVAIPQTKRLQIKAIFIF